jgi:hypothetical protein
VELQKELQALEKRTALLVRLAEQLREMLQQLWPQSITDAIIQDFK